MHGLDRTHPHRFDDGRPQPSPDFGDATETILNRYDSPDLGSGWSLNAYRGWPPGPVGREDDVADVLWDAGQFFRGNEKGKRVRGIECVFTELLAQFGLAFL